MIKLLEIKKSYIHYVFCKISNGGGFKPPELFPWLRTRMYIKLHFLSYRINFEYTKLIILILS